MNNTPSHKTQHQPYDALVIGGGPAGLQAALTLARVHREVLLVDAGQPRNAPAAHMHNFLTHDGTPPAEFRAQARDELAALPTTTLLDDTVSTVRKADQAEPGSFVAETASGQTMHTRRVVLASGMRDVLPEVPGLAELFGRLVHHCPFCHGHELAGKRVGLLASEKTAHLGLILEPVADEVVMLDSVRSVAEIDGRVQVTLEDGSTTTVDGLFTPTELVRSAPHAEQLGLRLLASGAVEVDLFGRTSLDGVFAAGDGAHHRDLPMPQASVLAAAAAGQMVGGACVASLLG